MLQAVQETLASNVKRRIVKEANRKVSEEELESVDNDWSVHERGRDHDPLLCCHSQLTSNVVAMMIPSYQAGA